MTFLPCLRAHPLIRIAALALAWPLLTAQTPAAGPIVFPFENKSDLRGLLNVFAAFRRACLDQPVTKGLAETLAPEGYQVVRSDLHVWGEEAEVMNDRWIVSKTGREADDFDGGHPFVELKVGTERAPDGECRVVWHRAWDYADGVDKVAFDLAATLDSQISYHLKAILLTKPDPGFAPGKRYSTVSDWYGGCWPRHACSFKVITSLDQQRGIEMQVTRTEARGPGSGGAK